MDPVVLRVEGSVSHSDTPNSVGLPWTSNHPDEENTNCNTQQSQETDFHDYGGILTRHRKIQSAANPNIRPRVNRDVFECRATNVLLYNVTEFYRGILIPS